MTHAPGYDAFYSRFDSPLMQQLRREAYGQDIGQHSWVTASELADDVPRLRLTRASRLLDLGCGPGGPLTFVVGQVGCRATGIDLSPPAITSATARAEAAGLGDLIDFRVVNSDEPLPLGRLKVALLLNVIAPLPRALPASAASVPPKILMAPA